MEFFWGGVSCRNLQKRLEILVSGILKKKSSLGESTFVTVNDIHHLEVLLKQAEYGNVSTEVMTSWVDKLQREIQFGRSQTEFAYLFGSVIQEWAATQTHTRGVATSRDGEEDEGTPAATAAQGDELDFGVEDDEYLRVLFPKEREVFVNKVEALFEPVPDSQVDFAYFEGLVENLLAYGGEGGPLLAKIDDSVLKKVALEEVKAAAQALCLDNLVSATTKRSLKSLQRDDVLANEYAGVMTLMLKNYQEWTWPREMPLKLVNNRSAKWRVFVEEDIVTALFLQVVGARWGARLRAVFNTLFNAYRPYPVYNAEKSDYEHRNQSGQLLVSALPRSTTDIANVSDYDGGGRGSSSSSSNGEMSLKQRLLQLISADTKKSRELQTPLTLVITDIENFYLSVSHKLTLAVMKGFGCPEPWLRFFETFLSPPVTLAGSDAAPIKTGRLSRGYPTGHALSKILHEPLLFLADFTMLQTKELRYQRNFDDFFFWSESPTVAVQAWTTLTDFTKKGGMALNLTKSGHIQVNAPETSVPGLPVGPVRYSLLAMDQKGNWVADDAGVEKVKEIMKMRLEKSTSVLAWVRSYNAHVNFLVRNLGEPCHALGSTHVDTVCKVLASIHSGINGVGVFKHLQTELANRFKERNLAVTIPEAWFYWPLTAGGLGVVNPFLTLSVLQLQILKGEQSASHKVPFFFYL